METDLNKFTEILLRVSLKRTGRKNDFLKIGVGLIIKLPKRGNWDCKNYRGIVFLSVPGKVLYIIFLERMKTELESKLCDH